MRIKDIRYFLGITQYELAKRVGVSQVLISQIERGYHKPSEGQKQAILRCLGVTEEDQDKIIWGPGQKPSWEDFKKITRGFNLP
jgi:transcriptional regulator with XRE-family HTH domain